MLKVKQEKIHVEEKMKLIEVQLISLGHKNESLEKDNMVRLPKISELHSEINPLTARIFTVFGQSLLDNRVLHKGALVATLLGCLLYTSPSPRDKRQSRMPSSA